KKVIPNENIKEIAGKVAIERGPIVYCAEQVDNRAGVLKKAVNEQTKFTPKYDSTLLQGVVKLESDSLTLIPYYAWSHRGLGEMEVWFNKK
ncbi:MAG: glycoside hydrolase family 127 protein, partial [Bacteroidales bacterium]|nr:glycoside hydrolase family 127 protein [Bacteroidales bacterium]